MNVLKVGRAKLGINQEQLGDMMNVGKMTVFRWENHKTVPNVSQIMELHYKLDIPLDDLMEFFVNKEENK